MAIRIDRIKINRGGPLDNDFEFEPGDLNLIYGRNESGKTYLVESIIQFLFRTDSKAPTEWELRGEWEPGGRVIVSGLEDTPVSFTKTKRVWLENYWTEELSFPIDLSPLLVVKAGETLLSKTEKDGVGRNILKNCLSGEGLLDKILQDISITLQEATAQHRQIEAANRGEMKSRIECENSLHQLNDLLKKVEEEYGSGVDYSLQQKKESIRAKIREFEQAKYYYASQLGQKIQDLERKKGKLQSETQLSELEADIRVHEGKNADFKRLSSNLEDLETTSGDYRWTEKALDNYSEITGRQAVFTLNPIFMITALVAFSGMMVTGFVGLIIPFLISSIGTAACFLFYYFRMRNALAQASESLELSKLKADFKARFNSGLTNKAALQAKLEELKEDYILANSLREQIQQLTLEINTNQNNITKTLSLYTDLELSPQQWGSAVDDLRNGIEELGDEIDSLNKKLTLLAVVEESYLDTEPEIEWDATKYDDLQNQLETTEEDLDSEQKKLEQLKTRVLQETRSDSTEWVKLITELQGMRDQKANEYRAITAEILAKIQVKTVLQEFRQQENSRIASSLDRPELTDPLRALTDRYNRVKQEEERGLVLVTDEDEEYALANISTGAQEQVFLALRVGFANIVMKGQTAFLILDDAFQHSDWARREHLVTHIVQLVDSGWQVFYFTMDDHIRDLFQDAGTKIGHRFKRYEIC